MKKLMTKTLLCSAAAAGLFLAAQAADAAITGACVTCHTMHNSQGGTQMNGTGTTNDNLLISENGCVGCHEGPANQLRNTFGAPIVYHTATTSTYPAGGSFFWVSTLDNKGHNVEGISSVDVALSNTPPGDDASFSGRLTCSSCHTSGGHHANGPGNAWVGGDSPANSYRFLSGIAGFEDSDWEWTVTSTAHNVYKAKAATTATDTSTISEFCARCHGNFHTSAQITDENPGASPWKRHPTDFQMPAGKEYDDYDTYTASAPVGYSSGTQPQSTIEATKNSVVCVSCHRVHGSEYEDMLRWSYSMNAGQSGDTGCFVCHTTK